MTRSSKQWDETVGRHLGQIVDNTKLTDLIDLFAYGGVATLGFQATDSLIGALIGVLGLKLATTDGIPSQTAGLLALGTLGLAGLQKAELPGALKLPSGRIATFEDFLRHSLGGKVS